MSQGLKNLIMLYQFLIIILKRPYRIEKKVFRIVMGFIFIPKIISVQNRMTMDLFIRLRTPSQYIILLQVGTQKKKTKNIRGGPFGKTIPISIECIVGAT
jgi:hypothetical protein